jgi:hypothetical protein
MFLRLWLEAFPSAQVMVPPNSFVDKSLEEYSMRIEKLRMGKNQFPFGDVRVQRGFSVTGDECTCYVPSCKLLLLGDSILWSSRSGATSPPADKLETTRVPHAMSMVRDNIHQQMLMETAQDLDTLLACIVP